MKSDVNVSDYLQAEIIIDLRKENKDLKEEVQDLQQENENLRFAVDNVTQEKIKLIVDKELIVEERFTAKWMDTEKARENISNGKTYSFLIYYTTEKVESLLGRFGFESVENAIREILEDVYRKEREETLKANPKQETILEETTSAAV
jgi:FtsZ-binding cell division protein ZapB